jgi:hypothetical protein
MTDEIRAQLWAMEDAGTLRRDMVGYLRKHGITAAEPKLTEFFRPALREEYEIRKAAGAADVLARAVADSGDLAGGGQAAVGKAFFDLIRAAQNPDPNAAQATLLNAASVFAQMQKSAHDKATLALKERDTTVAERRVAVLEKKLAEAKGIMGDKSLTDAEKSNRMKEVFGIA